MTTVSKRVLLLAFTLMLMSAATAKAQRQRLQEALEKRLLLQTAPNSKLRLNLLKARTPILVDRKYHTLKLPRGAYGGTLVVRNSHEFEKWLPEKQLTAKKDCKAYVAIQTRRNREVRAPDDLISKMKAAGWTQEKSKFTTSSAAKEVWVWAVFSKDVKEGPVKLKPPIKARTAYIFIFSEKK